MSERLVEFQERGLVLRIRHRRRWWRLLRALYFPLAVLFPLLLTGFLCFVAFRRAPVWANNPRAYLLSRRLGLALGMLGGFQLVETWVLGLASAGAGGVVAVRGAKLRPRLIIVRRRMWLAALAVVLLRLFVLLLLLGVPVLVVFLSGSVVIPPLWEVEEVRRSLRLYPLLSVTLAALAVVQWLVGPFLRMRYSVALGALAATWGRDRSHRRWLAQVARLSVGLAGILALLWGSTLALLIFFTGVDPRYSSIPPVTLPDWEVLIYPVVSAVLLISLVGQLVLPSVYVWLAGHRLAVPVAQGEKTAAP